MAQQNEMVRRTNFERIKEMFKLLESNEHVFKSDFESIGFNLKSVDEWIKIIKYIQNKSKIKEIKKGRITLYELQED